MKAVIAAAWYGTRMLPLTKVLPKELLPVWNKPVIQYIVEWLVWCGINNIVMITSQWKFGIEDYFDKNYELEEILKKKGKQDMLDAINYPKDLANFCFVRQKEQLWFPHAVMTTQPWIDGEYFMLTVGDTVFHPDVFTDAMALHQKTWSWVVVCKRVPHEEIFRYWVVDFDENNTITHMLEKPNPSETTADCIQVWVYILPTKIFWLIARMPYETSPTEIALPDVMLELMKTDTLSACVTDAWVRDTWNPESWLKANIELSGVEW